MAGKKRKETPAEMLAAARSELQAKAEQLKTANGRERGQLQVGIARLKARIRAAERRLNVPA